MSTDFEALDMGSIVTPRASRSHIRIVRPAAALGRNPGDVPIGILDVASLAVHAVLRVDHESGRASLLHPFVDAGRAIAGRRAGINVVLGRLLQAGIGDLEVDRLVLLVVGVGEEHRGQAVEGQLAVRPGIGDGPELRRGLQGFRIGLAVAQRASSSWARPAASAAATCSAASSPDSIALWLPLMRGTFMNPAAQPMSAPPGKASFGTDCQPPSVSERAP